MLMPNRIATNNTGRMSPPVSALMNVVGMMFIRKPTMLCSCALLAYVATAPASSEAGSMPMPAPGWTTLATTMPTTSAKLDTTMK